MYKKLAIPAVLGLSLGLVACGGGSSKDNKSSSIAHSRPSRIYHVQLSGTAEPTRGAPTGTGAAIIAFHGNSTLCWRFAHLHGFTNPTSARIYAGGKGHSGKVAVSLSPGHRLHHQGCVTVSPAVTQAIWNQPGQYYVNIHSSQYPDGAVRAQL